MEGDPVATVHGIVDKLTNGFYRTGKATLVSRLPTEKYELAPSVARSLHNRVERAEILKKVSAHKDNDPELVKKELRRAHLLDEFDRQFHNQQRIKVATPWGEQAAFGAVIDLTTSAAWQENDGTQPEEQPPIFLVPALSGDLYGVESLLRELALSGRRIAAIAYPESPLGTVTGKFREKVLKRNVFRPHATYFMSALNTMLGTPAAVELWGYSTGGPIAATILSDPQWQERVIKAVILAPASLVDQSMMGLMRGVMREGLHYLRRRERFPDIGIVLGAQDPQAKNPLRNEVVNQMIKMVRTQTDVWQTMRVRAGGKILVLAGDQDFITHGQQAKNVIGSPTDQIEVEILPGNGHLSPLTQAASIVAKAAANHPN
jgi:hypothetical protein